MIKPDAIATEGTCYRCGQHIEAWFVIRACDRCLEAIKKEPKKDWSKRD